MNIEDQSHITDYDLKENKRIKDTTELWFARFHFCVWEKHPQRTRVKDCKDLKQA